MATLQLIFPCHPHFLFTSQIGWNCFVSRTKIESKPYATNRESKAHFLSLFPHFRSLYIIYEWLSTLFETITKLSGAVGASESISRSLYMITRFNAIKSVSAFELYHSGDDIIVEADVVLPQAITLKDAHDIGEILQVRCEERR